MAETEFTEGQVEADGFTVRYTEAGQGDPVVMLGGLPWGLTALRDSLAQKYRVVVFELPGVGDSPPSTEPGPAKGLGATMAQASAKVVPDQYTLIGTSFAANVALWQALQAPDQVEALILVSPTAILPADGPTANTSEEVAKLLFAHPENFQGLPSLDPAVFAKQLGGATASHDAEAESRLGEIQCATLVVFGLADKLVAPEAAGIYRGKIPNSNLSIVYDAGHLIVAERPEALINAVADYVEHRETFIVGRQTGIINP